MAEPLRVVRRRHYLSMRELAKKAGVSYDTIIRIENKDYKQLRPKTMRAISHALDVQPGDIAEFAVPDREAQ